MQICYAYESQGGTVVVVLTQKDKLTMERLFRAAIPDRKGSVFVFRQGNALLPRDMALVAAVEVRLPLAL